MTDNEAVQQEKQVCSNKQKLTPEHGWQPNLKVYGKALWKSAASSLVVKCFGSDFNNSNPVSIKTHATHVCGAFDSINENSSFPDVGATESLGFVTVYNYNQFVPYYLVFKSSNLCFILWIIWKIWIWSLSNVVQFFSVVLIITGRRRQWISEIKWKRNYAPEKLYG